MDRCVVLIYAEGLWLVDASVVAELLRIATIAVVGWRDFTVVRPHHVKVRVVRVTGSKRFCLTR